MSTPTPDEEVGQEVTPAESLLRDLPQGLDFLTRNASTQNLFDECHDALHGAFLMFCLPDLKACAREGLLQGDAAMIQRIVDLPTNFHDIVTIYSLNKKLLTEQRLKCEDRAEMYEGVMNLSRADGKIDEETKASILKQIHLHVLDDVNETEELVYAIAHNPFNKRITIAFRGSVTEKDFQQDAKALRVTLENPILKSKTKIDQADVQANQIPDEVGLHWGFKEYLYGTTEQLKQKDYVPKYKIIMDQVGELLEKFPDCQLRIVGHSLGGALTTVLALEAAGDDRVPTPITAITSGAPKVGNLQFFSTFEYLEETGRIRCIQVANNKDPVTQAPPVGNFDPCAPVLCRQRIFRHVSLRLLLVPKGFVIWYPAKAKSCPGILAFDLLYVATNCCLFFMMCIAIAFCCNIFAILAIPACCCCSYKFLKKSRQHHTQLKYIHRLEHCKEELESLSLDELNAERFGRSVFASRVLAKKNTRKPFHESLKQFGEQANDVDDDESSLKEEQENDNKPAKDIEQGAMTSTKE